MALNFDGTAASIEPNPVASATLGANYTLSCWVRAEGSLGTSKIISRAMDHVSPQAIQWQLSRTGANVFEFLARSDDTTLKAASAGTVTIGDWFQLVARKIGEEVTIFVNGVEGTPNSTGTFDTFTDATRWVIAASFTGATGEDSWWDGDIAEFAVWDTDLTDDECTALGERAQVLSIRPQSMIEYLPMYTDVDPSPNFSGGQNNAAYNGSPVVADHPPIGRWPLTRTAPSTIKEIATVPNARVIRLPLMQAVPDGSGNVYRNVRAVAPTIHGVWEFIPDLDGSLHGIFQVPTLLSATPEAIIILEVMNEGTTGQFASWLVGVKTVGDGEGYNQVAVDQSQKNISMPTTAFLRKQIRFPLKEIVAPEDELIVKITHQGSGCSDNLATNAILVNAYLEIDTGTAT